MTVMSWFVSPAGRDEWSGARPNPDEGQTDGPFASLERALQAARDGRRAGAEGAMEIVLRGGKHFRDKTLRLTADDSGTARDPLIVRAAEGEEVRLIGGREIRAFSPASDPAIVRRLPVAARGRVLQCDLKAEGVRDFGAYHPRGHSGGSAHAALELFYNGRVMTVARWPKRPPLPNRGFIEIAGVKDGRLYVDDDRPRSWETFDDVHLHGYFACDWASSIVRVKDFDPATRSVACIPPEVSAYGARKGGRFFFFNVLDELGEPGEWFLDRKTGVLYFWPPGPPVPGEAIVSTLDGPLISLKGVNHVRLERLTIEAMRGDGIAIEGGSRNVIAGCVLRNIGRHGVSILEGVGHEVLSCDIYETGECGVDILAGDRKTLVPCGHRVHNCHLHHIAREGWTYCNAVRMAHNLDLGCGVTVSNNRMHEHRHALLHYKGNDHLIERNEFYNMTLEGDDCGCLYTGRDFAMQGNVVRHNAIHHAGASGRSDWGSFGVYMDDCGGGTDVYGNVFHCIDKAVLAGGGVNTRIHDNVFVGCSPAVWFDERGASAAADGPGSMVHDTMRANFEHVSAHQPGPYARYPNLDRVQRAFREHLGVYAWGGGVFRNVVCGSRGEWLATHWTVYPPHFEFHDNWFGADPGFADPDFDVFALRDDSPAYARIGIARIPFESIGLQRDEYRPRLVDARARVEVLRPLGGRGEPGRARLVVRNTGGVEVAGEELVEFRTRRHGPGIGLARVPYRVAPGQTGAFEFEVAIAPPQLRGQHELLLCSRGEHDLRPHWASIPIAYVLDSELALLAPLTARTSGPPARVRLTVRNAGSSPVAQDVEVTASPADGVRWLGARSLRVDAAPGATVEREIAFGTAMEQGVAEGPLLSRVVVETRAAGVRPARLPLIVEYPLPRFPGLDRLEEVASRLARETACPVRGRAKNTLGGDYGEVRLAIAGDELILRARVRDPAPRVTPMMWDGSCVEVYACSPDRERIGHVFGNIPIGQVYLVPAAGGKPARGLIEKDNSQIPAPEIRVASEPCPDGYVLTAAVPLARLAVSPESGRFLFEIQVNTPRSEGHLAGRGNLFGSCSAFNDTSSYAMAVFA